MDIKDMIQNFSGTREKEIRGIFASIIILQNRLQTIFDKSDDFLTLKQFMLLTMIIYSDDKTTFTRLGELIGSSRQNVKNLAKCLEEKGFIIIEHEAKNKRNTEIKLTLKAKKYSVIISEMHQKKLNSIFSDYTDEEIQTFYKIIMKLYGGVTRTEEEIKG
ncbi:MarR family transcriptional regulator [Leuconostoc koreense]|nr:MarR family transcriptional regulator [Leuconostoc mesenteroides]QGM25719.1 MarR family transcriptional regulator [Leuconostoc mesenteroides subsp. mesenteroides]